MGYGLEEIFCFLHRIPTLPVEGGRPPLTLVLQPAEPPEARGRGASESTPERGATRESGGGEREFLIVQEVLL
jgi:hypothetical protein